MANYPTADPSFPTRSNGQSIDASHVNVLGDEIVAIGSALRGTLQHGVTIGSTHSLNVGGNSTISGSVSIGGALSAGNSTVANLQVTGGSTFGGTLTFSGLFTASSGVLVSTGVVRQNSLPCWSVYGSTGQAFTNGGAAGFAFDAQSFVRGNIEHSTGTNSSRVTLNTTGIYSITFTGRVQPANGLRPRANVLFNDGASTLLQNTMSFAANTDETLLMTGVVRISDTGYLTVRYTSSNGASTVGSSAFEDAYRFMGYFVG